MKMRRLLALLAVWALALTAALPSGTARADGPKDMPYRIEVDISSQIVTVYENKTGEIVRQMLCSTGGGDSTPTGDFIMQADRATDRKPWYYIADFRRYVRYPARIFGALLFHSLPYMDKSLLSPEKQAMKDFGFPASHGCVRLRWEDAKFISDNCLSGTAVRITKSGERSESLRQLLYQQSFDADQGFSYDSFLGVSDEPGALGRGSQGPEVLDLQYRLRDLGIYDGEMTGEYDGATVNAVRMAQYLLSEALTGAASVDFRQRLYADDAPTAMNVALTAGMGGPAVRKLQENLAALRLYDESELDSVYDVGVSGAVSRFQKVYGYKVTGEASPEVQKAIDYEAGRLRQTFDGATYDFKENADQQLVQLVYTSPEDGRVYTVGCTAQDVLAGARKPSEVFAEYLAANEQTTDISQLVNYATVDTHGQALSLNLRAEPNAESDVLAMVEDGASLRVERQYAEWTQVRYGGAEGYLMNAYLRFWTGPEDAIPSGEDQAAADAAAQVDYATAKASAGVYDDNTDAAELLGRLPKGTQVEVLEMDDSWCLIQYKGHQGWALREDLQLVMLEDAQS